jgi:hypothetical protein
MRLSQEKSQTTGTKFPLDLLCRLAKVPRSSFYEYRRQRREVLRETIFVDRACVPQSAA